MNEDVREVFRIRIFASRNALGLTQAELGEALGMSQANISQFESGRRTPRIDTLREFAVALNVSADYLLGIKDEP